MKKKIYLIEYYADNGNCIRFLWVKANTIRQACMIVGLWDNQAYDIITCNEESEIRPLVVNGSHVAVVEIC